MNQTTTRAIFSSLLLAITLGLTACGGGDTTVSNMADIKQKVDQVQWPQPVAFTDFTGEQTYLDIGTSIWAKNDCQTCISVYGVARSSTELGNLLNDRTAPWWPPLYKDKLFSELPIDYNSKMAVVLEDLGSGARYRYAVQKVEESEATLTITILKCMVYDVYQDGYSIRLGLLIPKSNKIVNVVMVQSGKPTLTVYEPNGLGAC